MKTCSSANFFDAFEMRKIRSSRSARTTCVLPPAAPATCSKYHGTIATTSTTLSGSAAHASRCPAGHVSSRATYSTVKTITHTSSTSAQRAASGQAHRAHGGSAPSADGSYATYADGSSGEASVGEASDGAALSESRLVSIPRRETRSSCTGAKKSNTGGSPGGESG